MPRQDKCLYQSAFGRPIFRNDLPFIAVTLTRMNEAELQPIFVLKLPDQRRDLDKIRPSADYQIQSARFTGGIAKPHLF
jgi:hypothetical protein